MVLSGQRGRSIRIGKICPACQPVPSGPYAASSTTWFSALFERVDVPARYKICSQGGVALYLYCLLEGRVSLQYKPYDGPRIHAYADCTMEMCSAGRR